MGVAFQLLWVTFIPVGASMYTNESVVMAALAAFAAGYGEGRPEVLMALFLLCIPFTVAALKTDYLTRSANGLFANFAKQGILSGHYRVAQRFHLVGVALNWLNGIVIGWSVMLLLLIAYEPIVSLLYRYSMQGGLSLQWLLLPLIGTLFLAHDSFRDYRSYIYFAIGCVGGVAIIAMGWLS